jgi:hypothetical protein
VCVCVCVCVFCKRGRAEWERREHMRTNHGMLVRRSHTRKRTSSVHDVLLLHARTGAGIMISGDAERTGQELDWRHLPCAQCTQRERERERERESVCVCVCFRGREGGRKEGREKEHTRRKQM